LAGNQLAASIVLLIKVDQQFLTVNCKAAEDFLMFLLLLLEVMHHY